MIEANDLRKRYGSNAALDGLDLSVAAGSVHGLLGPNGAGKTTLVRILTTLAKADGGTATVAGFDVARRPDKVKQAIGLVGQHAAVDEVLSATQNLVMFGRLCHLPTAHARARAGELLDQFGLADTGNKAVQHFSGGMRRRLDLAAGMILAPRVLFLDEPTTGLDPRGRAEVWAAVRDLARQGTTVLMTTQYLDEADQLADRVSVVNHGRVVADGTPDELKARLGDDRLELRGDPDALAAAMAAFGPVTVDRDERKVTVSVRDRMAALNAAMRHEVEDVTLRRPTLDEVFLNLTEATEATEGATA
ncbi:ATP-binding cassette domain-containing protein [Dactylosporangium sucinum]|uniref:Daunorubicin resistance protein DrrA family ABC transporter ATP-binding protein n=1 Tax=Dactylosporangium sucinum TaxID=1424081 RepID=A0A917TUB6_9ACTN|nr:ATP-binding cassette domain-containing protein [Dactylosporangium sucinum]GGM37791.1 daunorubicin resistance protein DrrA family ABC transporter ATP-binding protein [Dactylosporangium sucinum]